MLATALRLPCSARRPCCFARASSRGCWLRLAGPARARCTTHAVGSTGLPRTVGRLRVERRELQLEALHRALCGCHQPLGPCGQRRVRAGAGGAAGTPHPVNARPGDPPARGLVNQLTRLFTQGAGTHSLSIAAHVDSEPARCVCAPGGGQALGARRAFTALRRDGGDAAGRLQPTAELSPAPEHLAVWRRRRAARRRPREAAACGSAGGRRGGQGRAGAWVSRAGACCPLRAPLSHFRTPVWSKSRLSREPRDASTAIRCMSAHGTASGMA